MKTETISYATLSERVKDAVLFNNHSVDDEFWYEGLIAGPHIETVLEEMDKEKREEALQAIKESTDAGEKAKLTEELEDIETATVMDLCEGCIYQTYAITPEGARYLFNHTAEVISYSEKLDIFLWHIRHYGTSWNYVHTQVYDWESEETPEWYAYSIEDILQYKAM